MPRLLSNKEPTHHFKSEDKKLIGKSEQKILSKPKVVGGSALRTLSEQKSEDEMSSWEYYCSLMKFGRRKMDKHEWQIWRLKKDEEDSYKRYFVKKYNRPKEKMSAAEYNWRVYHVGDIPEAESDRQQFLCHYD